MTEPARADGNALGRWALAGLGPAGRFLLERWSLRQDFPLVAIALNAPGEQKLAAGFRLPVRSCLKQILDDPHIHGLILTSPLADLPSLIRAALAAGKHILVEGSLCDSAAEASRIEHVAQSSERSLGVFQVRRADSDFRAALSLVADRRLGTLHTVRWIDCEYSVPARLRDVPLRPSWRDALSSPGVLLFEQLAHLIEADPISVQAWPRPETAGFQARLEYPADMTAWIDVQRASLAGLRTGWVLEGTAGAYRGGRVMTLADDGEVREEEILPVDAVDDDVMADLRRLATDDDAARNSLSRSVRASLLKEAIQQAALR